jgi:uncharacterized protein
VVVDRIVKWLLPREDRFFLYLNSIAGIVGEAADIFGEFRTAQGPEDFKRIADRLRRKEHEADELAHVLYRELDKTFVTPIDREDLHALTAVLDDVIDNLERCASQIVLYKVPQLSEQMREMARVAQEAARGVTACMLLLQHLGTRADEIQVVIIRVNSLENEADKIYRQALEKLFDTMVDPIELFRQKEILDATEEAINCCEDVTDLIRSVVVKNG